MATDDFNVLDGTTGGSTVQVTTISAGDNNIGNVDVLSVIPGTAATNLGKAQDTAVGATDTGVGMLGKRVDSLATVTPAVADFVFQTLGQYGEAWMSLATNIAASAGDSIAIKNPTTQIKKSFNATTTQAGTDVWSPASGKKIRVTTLQIGTYGTTGARLILWFGANADTTFSEGTDETLFKGSFVPSATDKPGIAFSFVPPFEATTADYELHCTTDAGMSVDIVVVGYEE